MNQPAKLLTIGGSDPCGAYGLTADLKTFTVLGAHGMGVVTVVTAQNSQQWYGASYVSASFIAQQMNAVFSDYGADWVKTGFLGRPDIVQGVALKLAEFAPERVLVDPVLVNHAGQPLFEPPVRRAYFEQLFPLADILTPNLAELAYLLGQEVLDVEAGARQLYELWAEGGAKSRRRVLIVTGCPRPSAMMGDLWYDGEQMHWLERPHLQTNNVAGSGDVYGAALLAYLSQGQEWLPAAEQAQQFTHNMLKQGADWALAHGRGPLGLATIGGQWFQ